MRKLSAVAMVLAFAVTLAAVPGFAKGSAYPACKGLKGKERAECVKAEKAKKAETKTEKKTEKKAAEKPAAK